MERASSQSNREENLTHDSFEAVEIFKQFRIQILYPFASFFLLHSNLDFEKWCFFLPSSLQMQEN